MKPSRYTKAAVWMLCIVLLITTVCVPVQRTQAKTVKKTGVVTADSLNVRTAAGTEYDKLSVKGSYAYLVKGQKVNVLKERNGWYYIEFLFAGEKQTGYVLADYVKVSGSKPEMNGEITPVPPKQPVKKESLTIKANILKISAKISAELLNVRSNASTSGTVKEKLTKGEKVTILNVITTSTGQWYKVKVGKSKTTGYVLGDYVVPSYGKGIKAYIQSPSKINVRKSASSKGAYIKYSTGTKITLKNQAVITVLSEKVTDGVRWLKMSVKTGKKTYIGYVPAENVSYVKPSKKAVATPTPQVTKKPTPTEAPEEIDEPEESEETPTPTVMPTSTPTVMPTSTPTVTPTPTPTVTPTPTPIVTSVPVSAALLSGNIAVLTMNSQPVLGTPQVTDAIGNSIYIYPNMPFAVYQIINSNGMNWYQIGIQNNGMMYYGYILCEFASMNSAYNSYVQQWPMPSVSNPNEVTPVQSTVTPYTTPVVTPSMYPTQTPVVSQIPMTAEEFERKMTTEGFPESYKPMLRELHTRYPLWQFEAHQTGLDWNTVIQKESRVGWNLIPNSKSIEWKSLAQNAYKWETDKFVPIDGASWVTASEAAISYYMDPRNFLTNREIFQFELLAYKGDYQDVEGVENILKNTALYRKTFSFTDDYGNTRTMTYAQAFLEAAQYSNVSPYHLASRAKQEVVTGTTGLSNSVSGTVSGYEGLYNFYNIGAYHSTAAGGAVAHGLKYALNGSGNAALDQMSKIPWDSPYDAIVGGSYIIGKNYINRGAGAYRGQDTIYLQKFNVTNNSTYSHQYMSNVEAAFTESKKMYQGYENLAELPIVFSIPVYNNMPVEKTPYPAPQKNPNNWLRTLNVLDNMGNQLALTPSFKVGEQTEYSLIVDYDVDTVQINAAPVSNKALVMSGTGYLSLMTGYNQVDLPVRAENGDVKTYKLTIVRQQETEY